MFYTTFYQYIIKCNANVTPGNSYSYKNPVKPDIWNYSEKKNQVFYATSCFLFRNKKVTYNFILYTFHWIYLSRPQVGKNTT